MRKRTLALAAPAAVLAIAAAAQSQTQAVTLRASVDDPGTIALTRNGKAVTRLKPGIYRVVVSDTSGDHNFTLRRAGGPTRQLTTVPFVGTRSV